MLRKIVRDVRDLEDSRTCLFRLESSSIFN